VDVDDLVARVRAGDPALGLRAVGALHRLAEQVECVAVAAARQQGWSWEQIGDALGVSRQSAHAKHGPAADQPPSHLTSGQREKATDSGVATDSAQEVTTDAPALRLRSPRGRSRGAG